MSLRLHSIVLGGGTGNNQAQDERVGLSQCAASDGICIRPTNHGAMVNVLACQTLGESAKTGAHDLRRFKRREKKWVRLE